MSNLTKTRATTAQTIDLANKLWAQGATADDAVAWLKSQKYCVNGLQYYCDKIAIVIETVYRIEAGIKAGSIKASKSKGLEVVKASKPKPVPVQEDLDVPW